MFGYKPKYLYRLILSFQLLFLSYETVLCKFSQLKYDLKLENHPTEELCTVRLTVMSFSHEESSDIAEELLLANIDSNLWTVRSLYNKSSFRFKRINEVLEQCSINILIDGDFNKQGHLLENDKVVTYLNTNQFSQETDWKHSVFIMIFGGCSWVWNEIYRRLPIRLFVHMDGCKDNDFFPNNFFVSRSSPALRSIKMYESSLHDRHMPKQLKDSIRVPNFAWDKHMNDLAHPYCLRTRWIPKDVSSRRGYFCKTDRFIVHHWQEYMNISVYFIPPLFKYWKETNGVILSSIYSETFVGTVKFKFYDSKQNSILYCESGRDASIFQPLNILTPFRSQTWVLLIGCLLFISLLISIEYYRESYVDKSGMKFILKTFSKIYELYCILVEKDMPSKEWLTLMVSVTVIILSNMQKTY
jgi:hypothetical protein